MNKSYEHNNLKIIKGQGITYPKGFKAAGINSGIRLKSKDMALIYSERLASAAVVYTQNKFKAAPLWVTEENMVRSGNKLQAILVNSGIANACTGKQGLKDAWETVSYVSENLRIREEHVAVTSTGKIGEYLPMDRMRDGVKEAVNKLSVKGGADAAEAILTTDTRKKEIAVSFCLDGQEIKIGGMAKGSGMIHPNMATMLGFITTDLAIESSLLQEALKEVIAKTFNMISVDGDTSTNDMVVVLANGLAGNLLITEKNKDYCQFKNVLNVVAEYLAKEIARDGEGATRLVEAEVEHAMTDSDAVKIAKAVVGSLLVKAAIYGHDPNWGRVFAAAGYSGAQIDVEKVDLYLKEKIVSDGQPLPFSRETVRKYLEESPEIKIIIDLKLGEGKATAWGCDLTHEYININTKYS